MNKNIPRDFQICISVLENIMLNRISVFNKKNSTRKIVACPKKSTDDPREKSINENLQEVPMTEDP